MPTHTSRRTFLKLTTAAASVSAVEFSHALPAGKAVALIIEPDSQLTASEPVRWAAEKFRQALAAKGITPTDTGGTLTVVVSPMTGGLAKAFGNLPSISQAETTALLPGTHNNAPAILVTGVDSRGIVYGLLELTDRVRLNDNPLTALHLSAPVVEITPNKVRSVARAFLSEIEDKSWFYDRAFWTGVSGYDRVCAIQSLQLRVRFWIRLSRAALPATISTSLTRIWLRCRDTSR